jgi:hypothetical protein
VLLFPVSIEPAPPAEMQAKADYAINSIEEAIVRQLPLVDFPVTHKFAPGMYVREIFMPAGSVLTSRIHKFEHPFVISKGVISVWSLNEGTVCYRAPHTGITLPGTRRVLLAHEDTIWTTFHLNPDNITDPDALVAILTQEHENPMLGGEETV